MGFCGLRAEREAARVHAAQFSSEGTMGPSLYGVTCGWEWSSTSYLPYTMEAALPACAKKERIGARSLRGVCVWQPDGCETLTDCFCL